MGQTQRKNFMPIYTFPEIRKGKKEGWRVIFYYQKSGKMQRHRIRVDKYRKRFATAKESEQWILDNVCAPLAQELARGWTPDKGMQKFCVAENIKLSELLDMYFEETCEKFEAKLIRDKSLARCKSYCNIIRKALDATSGGLEDYNIREISIGTADKIVRRLRAQREWNITSTNNFIKFCRSLFKFAVDNTYISQNPFDKVTRIKGEEQSRRTLTSEEQQKIYAHLRETDLPYLIFTQLVYADLIRPVEILRLQCKDYNKDSWAITLSADKTKNKKSRTVYVPDTLKPLFATYLKTIDFDNLSDDTYIFHEGFRPARAAEPLPSQYASARWAQMRKDIGLADDCKLYGLRHTGITDLLDILPANTVRIYADHADLQQTAHYGDHRHAEKRLEVARRAPIFGSGGGVAAQTFLMI